TSGWRLGAPEVGSRRWAVPGDGSDRLPTRISAFYGLGGSAGGLDLLFRLRREGVRLDGQGTVDLTLGQHLHPAAMADETALTQELGGHLGAGVELVEGLQVDDGEVFLVGVLESRQLRQPHGQRGLAALETGAEAATGLEPLGAATGGLAAASALTATDPDLGLLRARRRLQVMALQFFSFVGHAVLHRRKSEVGVPLRRRLLLFHFD